MQRLQYSVISDRTGLKIPIRQDDLPDDTGIIYHNMPVRYNITRVEDGYRAVNIELEID